MLLEQNRSAVSLREFDAATKAAKQEIIACLPPDRQ
jgi:hypothetical protein